MRIKNDIRDRLFQWITARRKLKYRYLKFAAFCSTKGIRPPFSPSLENSVRRWEGYGTAAGAACSESYSTEDRSIHELFRDVLAHLRKDSPVLEIGCNTGRALNYLYKNGYTNLTGVEISPEAAAQMKRTFPEAYAHSRIITGNAPEILPSFGVGAFELVFCHSVLVNIHPGYNRIFGEMARISRHCILMLENEGSLTLYPRDFRGIFERLGFKMVSFKVFRQACSSLAVPFREEDVYCNNTIRFFVKDARAL